MSIPPLSGSDRAAKRRRLSPEIKPLEADKTGDIHHPRPRPLKAAFLHQAEDHSESSLGESVSRWLESLHSGQQSPSRSDSFSEQDAQSGHSRSSSLSGQSLVEDTAYLGKNLRKNNIFMKNTFESRPEHVAEAVSYVRRDRDSPGPSPDDVMRDGMLEGLTLNVDESEVEDYFSRTVFPFNTAADTIEVARRVPMPKDTVPNFVGNGGDRISNPVPDMIYGYNRQNAFSSAQMNYLDDMDLRVRATNGNQNTVYPFFAVEFMGSDGGLWVATNQCLGGTAACIQIAETLNEQLARCGSEAVQRVNSTAFFIAMNGSEARLYVSWKHDELCYYSSRIGSFVLQDPENFLQFRKHVRNIVEWGRDRRLKEIQAAIDTILEEERKSASARAKARSPPDSDADVSRTGSVPSTRSRGRSRK